MFLCLAQGLEPTFEPLVVQLLQVTYERAKAVITSRRDVIGTLAHELLTNT